MLPAAETDAFAASKVVLSGRGLFRGYTLYNSHADDACLVKFYDAGAASTLRLISTVSVPKTESRERNPTGPGIYLEGGLYIVVAGGTLEGIAMFNAEERIAERMSWFTYATQDYPFNSMRAQIAAMAGL